MTNLHGGLVSVELRVFAFNHSVSLEKKSLSTVALLLFFEHPLSKSLGLLADDELLGLGGFL